MSENSNRKFIIVYHVYPGSRFKDFALWNDHPNHAYFSLLRKHKDRVVAEIAGHDHLASLRAHSGSHVLDLEDPPTEFNFHNLIIAPSFTPWYGNNPAVSGFIIDDQTMRPRSFQATYLNLKPTVGRPHETPYDNL